MQIVYPMGGCQVVMVDGRAVLFGQPPEVIKGLARHGINSVDTLVLRDSREAGDVLLGNIEFPLYHFLFIANGLQQGRKLRLVGYSKQISQALEVLRLTLLGPTREELIEFGTEAELREEWCNAQTFFALKDAAGEVLRVEAFFEIFELDGGAVDVCGVRIEHTGQDCFRLSTAADSTDVDLRASKVVDPPYPLHPDQTPSTPITFGLDVLGGASGFSTEEASTGLVLNFHGDLMLIDSIPFLDQHLAARGISKNQVSAILLTHLHDDHCNMFPLMLASRRLDLITTREIYEMAITKLAMGLGWSREAVAECFDYVELKPGEPLHYFGLEIDAHTTVHSIPTIGATFSLNHLGRTHTICVVGDNQSFDEIAQMREHGLLRADTESGLRALYTRDFDLLVADGGMGVIHGDPADAMDSRADKVVFVHVDRLPDRFSTTFSLASSGKRYAIVDSEADLLSLRAMEFFQMNFASPVPRRWLKALLSDKRVLRFNREDVILKQGSDSRGNVYLVLAGSCDVTWHDGARHQVVGTREAGDFIGEMAAVTGVRTRNASVVASTPVILCEFSEETFHAFVRAEGLVPELRARWQLRDRLSATPALKSLSTAVIEMLCDLTEEFELSAGSSFEVESGFWYLLTGGEASDGDASLSNASEGGDMPFYGTGWQRVHSDSGCRLARLDAAKVRELAARSPQLSYRLRQYRQQTCDAGRLEWLL